MVVEMSKLALEEQLALLNKNNPAYEGLKVSLTVGSDHNWRLEKKVRDLVEVVQGCIDIGREPIIDRSLGLVIGVNAHKLIRARLYRYHKLITDNGPAGTREEIEYQADSYITEGFGYFFSSMNTRTAYLFNRLSYIKPIVSRNYKPDRFDKELFKFYNFDLMSNGRY
jgi:hypothetical protein